VDKWKVSLLIGSLITWIACSNLWPYTDLPIYYFGIAQIIFVSSLIIYNQPHQLSKQKFISRIFLFIAANNLIDELIFDPQAFEWNEYLSFLAFLVYSSWKTYKS
jgi:hypothetical protein